MRPVFPLAAFLAAAVLPAAAPAQSRCAPDNAELQLPAGFCAQIVADKVGGARHVLAFPNGDLAIAIQGANGGILLLRDTDGDGVADERNFTPTGPASGIAWFDGHLYYASNDAVVRFPWKVGDLVPSGAADTIVSGMTNRRQHAAKTIAIANDGMLYVNIGVPSNSCQVEDRKPESKGQDPCPLLDIAGGIWRFDARRHGQTQADGTRWVTGTRNVVGITMDPSGTTPWGMQHGRDNLNQNWGGMFTVEQSAENPAEEMFRLDKGADFGWPYCYFSVDEKKKVLAPEYGGDGKAQGRCANISPTEAFFPGHWAPNAILFYTGKQFPQEYRGGAFVAFHGSWNRAPLPQAGFNVAFVPFRNGKPSGAYRVFADGFRGGPTEQNHRPTGLAVAPDGSLIVTDDRAGRVYRISTTRG